MAGDQRKRVKSNYTLYESVKAVPELVKRSLEYGGRKLVDKVGPKIKGPRTRKAAIDRAEYLAVHGEREK